MFRPETTIEFIFVMPYCKKKKILFCSFGTTFGFHPNLVFWLERNNTVAFVTICFQMYYVILMKLLLVFSC